MPKFGFYLQDVVPVPWRGAGGKAHPGDDIGCELALRHTKKGDEVFIKAIVGGGPAGLSGQLAVGDAIAEINGVNPLEDHGTAQSLHSLLGEGEVRGPALQHPPRSTPSCSHAPLRACVHAPMCSRAFRDAGG